MYGKYCMAYIGMWSIWADLCKGSLGRPAEAGDAGSAQCQEQGELASLRRDMLRDGGAHVTQDLPQTYKTGLLEDLQGSGVTGG